MAESKYAHTPWWVGSSDDSHMVYGTRIYAAGGNGPVAVADCSLDDGGNDAADTEAAHARLIAAAPELLEMCVEAKDEFEAVHRDCALARYKKCDVCAHILPELRAAIAKATGS